MMWGFQALTNLNDTRDNKFKIWKKAIFLLYKIDANDQWSFSQLVSLDEFTTNYILTASTMARKKRFVQKIRWPPET